MGTFDPFGKGLCRYTFERVCRENGELLGDGSKIIIFNTKGFDTSGISEELSHFLTYFENSTDEYVSSITDESIIMLHESITELKKRRDLEDGYMKFEELLNSRERKEIKKRMLQVLEHKGILSEEISSKINAENNYEVLNSWFKLALESDSVEDFIKKSN